MRKPKIIATLTILVATTAMTSLFCFAETVNDIKVNQTYQPGSYICSEMENADLKNGSIPYYVNSTKKTLDISTIHSIGLKELQNDEYVSSGTSTEVLNKMYVLNNNINSECSYIPVYEMTGEKNGKSTFSMIGYLEDGIVYVEDAAYTEMKKYYQTDFSLDKDDISEDGKSYYSFDLPSEADLGDEVKEEYILKYWEYGYTKSDGVYFKAKILPDDESLIRTVKFYTIDNNGEYVLVKAEEVEKGTSATAPEINGTWDKSFDNVTENIEVYQSKETVKSEKNKTENVSGNTVKDSNIKTIDENPQTGDGDIIFMYIGVAAVSFISVLLMKRKNKDVHSI